MLAELPKGDPVSYRQRYTIALPEAEFLDRNLGACKVYPNHVAFLSLDSFMLSK